MPCRGALVLEFEPSWRFQSPGGLASGASEALWTMLGVIIGHPSGLSPCIVSGALTRLRDVPAVSFTIPLRHA